MNRAAGGQAVKFALIVAGVLTAGVILRELSPSAGYTSEHVLNLTAEEVESRVVAAPSEQVWVLDFWAPWCGPCREFSPDFAATADVLFPRASFGKVNIEENPEIARSFNVMSIPTVIVVRNGKVVQRTSGAMRRDDFIDWLEPSL